MKRESIVGGSSGQRVTVDVEDGQTVIGNHVDMAPLIKHVQKQRHVNEHVSSKKAGIRQHVGSYDMSMVKDFCLKHGYTLHDIAVNAGGERGPHTDPYWYKTDGGAKAKFMRHFLSRDFSKLHNHHVTTKAESSSIVVPNYIGSK